MGNDYGINRSGWREVSDGARRRLENAKKAFVGMVKKYSFDSVPDEDYKLTIEHAIKIHLVTKLRPKFNQYIKRCGAKSKWVKLNAEDKRKYFPSRQSAAYFCNITIDKDTKHKLREIEPDLFPEAMMEERVLFTKLSLMGIPEIDAIGWILKPKNVQKIGTVSNIFDFLDAKAKETKDVIVGVETLEQYQRDQIRKKKKRKKRKSSKKRKFSDDSETYQPSKKQKI